MIAYTLVVQNSRLTSALKLFYCSWITDGVSCYQQYSSQFYTIYLSTYEVVLELRDLRIEQCNLVFNEAWILQLYSFVQ